MNAAAGPSEVKNPKTEMTHAEMKVPDLRVSIDDLIAEDDKVVVRNHWMGTDAVSKQRLEFSGMVIWRIANHQIVERWAYLESPHPARG